MTEPRWLTAARADIGVAEIAGPQSNPRIMAYHVVAKDGAADETVPWCGAALAAWMSEEGIAPPPGAARARAWLDWGVPIETPVPGAVTVLSRGSNPEQGHVCLFLADRGDRIEVLGGNQGDAVSITSFPRERLLGYRWPRGEPLPEAPSTARKVVGTSLTSNTVHGSLLSILGAIAAFFEQATRLLLESAAAVTSLAPVKQALSSVGANVPSIGFGLVVFGAGLAITRRLQAAAREET